MTTAEKGAEPEDAPGPGREETPGPDQGESPPSVAEDAPKGRVARRGRRLSEKRLKLAIVGVVIVIVVVVLLWGMVPEEIHEVSELVDDPGKWEGKDVNIKGVVVEWDPTSNEFTLADQGDRDVVLPVIHSGPIPGGFGLNVTAVIKGVLRTTTGGIPFFESHEIQIGCPSKY